MSRTIYEKNLKRLQKSVKGKESRLKENLRLFRHKVYQIIGILLIYHFFLALPKKLYEIKTPCHAADLLSLVSLQECGNLPV